jgi:hypothetical protein
MLMVLFAAVPIRRPQPPTLSSSSPLPLARAPLASRASPPSTVAAPVAGELPPLAADDSTTHLARLLRELARAQQLHEAAERAWQAERAALQARVDAVDSQLTDALAQRSGMFRLGGALCECLDWRAHSVLVGQSGSKSVSRPKRPASAKRRAAALYRTNSTECASCTSPCPLWSPPSKCPRGQQVPFCQNVRAPEQLFPRAMMHSQVSFSV